MSFAKWVRVGRMRPGDTPAAFLWVSIRWDGRRLSISGVDGPMRNGDALGGCGQCIDALGSVTESEVDVPRLRAVWERWHLNDMRAGCAHQREWPTDAPVTLRPLTWGPEYHRLRRAAEDGTMTPERFATWRETVARVERLTLGFYPPKAPELWGPDGERALAEGLVKIEREDTKTAGWVSPAEHPAGLLGKPCGECGHRYGSAWLFEPVPADVIEWLATLPGREYLPGWGRADR